MKTFNVRNVHQALPLVLTRLFGTHLRTESRNGPVLRFSGPVATEYEKPEERVVFWAERDCNPFFHLYESLWMLAGRNDVSPLIYFVPRMADFSDDGQVFHGAYGYRWRKWFAQDQLDVIVRTLKANPNDRRCVLSMWDGHADLGREGKDFPCNLQALFCFNEFGSLDMMVTNRSNDIVLGAYGANAVHFSYLHEYLARRIGVRQGRYWQVSMNFHAYEGDQLNKLRNLVAYLERITDRGQFIDAFDPYEKGEVEPFPLMTVEDEAWKLDLYKFFNLGVQDLMSGSMAWDDPFFEHVAVPMLRAFYVYKSAPSPRRFSDATVALGYVQATDWRKAAMEWIDRRRVRFERAQADGPEAVAEA